MTTSLFKTLACSLIAATTLASLPAEAGQRWRDRDGPRHGMSSHRGVSGSDMLAAGILGLAAGAIIGGIATQPRDVYVDPYTDGYDEPVRRYREPQPVYRQGVRADTGYEPWSREWYRYCSNRYRSFDAETGTFLGYDGVRRFCVAN